MEKSTDEILVAARNYVCLIHGEEYSQTGIQNAWEIIDRIIDLREHNATLDVMNEIIDTDIKARQSIGTNKQQYILDIKRLKVINDLLKKVMR